MERNIDRKTLSYSKGMTNVPSDLLSEDSELLESEGFVYRDGEMKPIQKPVCISGETPLEGKLMFVHKLADYRNLITYVESKNQLVCYIKFKNGDVESRDKQTIELGAKLKDVKSVGNTLVCATENGPHYLLYKGKQYKDLGTDLPEPKILISMQSTTDQPGKKTACGLGEMVSTQKRFLANGKTYGKESSYDENGLLVRDYESVSPENSFGKYLKYEFSTDIEKYDNAQKAIQGHVELVQNLCKQNKMFLYPFFIRVALKLHDGSYAKISNPIICYPSIHKNEYMVPVWFDEKGTKTWKKTTYDNSEKTDFMFFPHTSHLDFYAVLEGYKEWSDIVKEYVVFATKEVVPFKLEGKWDFQLPLSTQGNVYFDSVEGYEDVDSVKEKYQWGNGDGLDYPASVITPTYKTEKEMIDELLERTQYYKLFSLKTDGSFVFGTNIDTPYSGGWEHGLEYIKDGVLENLEVQEQLPKDDYYGWAKNILGNMFTYNNRLNAFGIERYPFSGFNYFTAKKIKRIDGISIYTHIVSDKMDAWVKAPADYYMTQYDGWLYYPDPNAKEMILYHDGMGKGRKIQLRQHPLLNGAYSFEKLPLGKDNAELDDEDLELPEVDSTAHETMDSQIYTSNVNNPFLFEAVGDNTVGTGRILGIVANTEAVSQGQFGQYPLLVFTDEGIYGMAVNSEGLYSAIYPISREVCLENSPLVPTDRLIFFASKKGLMAASGGSVGCMSEQMRGRTPMNFATIGDGKFVDFLKDCLVAYDYRDSMLRIFGKGKGYQYIYNMVDRTYSMVNSGMVAQAIVNDYPDNLIQDTDGKVYSLTEKPDINDDATLYSGTVTTRPLKLGGSVTLKSLRDVKNLRSTENGKLQLEVWGSNNARSWCKLHSLKGKPWKYFTFRYTLTDFKACDAFAGSIAEVQNRREDRIR